MACIECIVGLGPTISLGVAEGAVIMFAIGFSARLLYRKFRARRKAPPGHSDPSPPLPTWEREPKEPGEPFNRNSHEAHGGGPA
jgi:hypothetical protein